MPSPTTEAAGDARSFYPSEWRRRKKKQQYRDSNEPPSHILISWRWDRSPDGADRNIEDGVDADTDLDVHEDVFEKASDHISNSIGCDRKIGTTESTGARKGDEHSSPSSQSEWRRLGPSSPQVSDPTNSADEYPFEASTKLPSSVIATNEACHIYCSETKHRAASPHTAPIPSCDSISSVEGSSATRSSTFCDVSADEVPSSGPALYDPPNASHPFDHPMSTKRDLIKWGLEQRKRVRDPDRAETIASALRADAHERERKRVHKRGSGTSTNEWKPAPSGSGPVVPPSMPVLVSTSSSVTSSACISSASASTARPPVSCASASGGVPGARGSASLIGSHSLGETSRRSRSSIQVNHSGIGTGIRGDDDDDDEVDSASVELEIIDEPTSEDVLLGRGHVHVGNVGFRAIVDEHRSRYQRSAKLDKMGVAEEVVDIVHNRGGRFLCRPSRVAGGAAGWLLAPRRAALLKACHALRESRAALPSGRHSTEADTSICASLSSSGAKSSVRKAAARKPSKVGRVTTKSDCKTNTKTDQKKRAAVRAHVEKKAAAEAKKVKTANKGKNEKATRAKRKRSIDLLQDSLDGPSWGGVSVATRRSARPKRAPKRFDDECVSFDRFETWTALMLTSSTDAGDSQNENVVVAKNRGDCKDSSSIDSGGSASRAEDPTHGLLEAAKASTDSSHVLTGILPTMDVLTDSYLTLHAASVASREKLLSLRGENGTVRGLGRESESGNPCRPEQEVDTEPVEDGKDRSKVDSDANIAEELSAASHDPTMADGKRGTVATAAAVAVAVDDEIRDEEYARDSDVSVAADSNTRMSLSATKRAPSPCSVDSSYRASPSPPPPREFTPPASPSPPLRSFALGEEDISRSDACDVPFFEDGCDAEKASAVRKIVPSPSRVSFALSRLGPGYDAGPESDSDSNFESGRGCVEAISAPIPEVSSSSLSAARCSAIPSVAVGSASCSLASAKRKRGHGRIQEKLEEKQKVASRRRGRRVSHSKSDVHSGADPTGCDMDSAIDVDNYEPPQQKKRSRSSKVDGSVTLSGRTSDSVGESSGPTAPTMVPALLPNGSVVWVPLQQSLMALPSGEGVAAGVSGASNRAFGSGNGVRSSLSSSATAADQLSMLCGLSSASTASRASAIVDALSAHSTDPSMAAIQSRLLASVMSDSSRTSSQSSDRSYGQSALISASRSSALTSSSLLNGLMGNLPTMQFSPGTISGARTSGSASSQNAPNSSQFNLEQWLLQHQQQQQQHQQQQTLNAIFGGRNQQNGYRP